MVCQNLYFVGVSAWGAKIVWTLYGSAILLSHITNTNFRDGKDIRCHVVQPFHLIDKDVELLFLKFCHLIEDT